MWNVRMRADIMCYDDGASPLGCRSVFILDRCDVLCVVAKTRANKTTSSSASHILTIHEMSHRFSRQKEELDQRLSHRHAGGRMSLSKAQLWLV